MARKIKNPHAHENPEAFRAHVERCRSNAASRHTPKTRKGTRAAQRRSAIKSFD